jgi:hypothetical protein
MKAKSAWCSMRLESFDMRYLDEMGVRHAMELALARRYAVGRTTAKLNYAWKWSLIPANWLRISSKACLGKVP